MYLLDKNKEDCYGCNACVVSCPISAIEMKEKKGFFYPQIDTSKCIDCKKCIRVCDLISGIKRFNSIVFCRYGWNKNDAIRLKSTSGGAFPAIAQMYLEQYPGATIYGAVYKGHRVEHIAAYQLSEIQDMCRSKYIQSDISNALYEIVELVNEKKYVLFSGTPCQVAAVKSLVPKETPYLMTVDFVCHGVASPILFDKYLHCIEKRENNKIVSYSFRNKKIARKKSSSKYVFIEFENGKKIKSEKELFYIAYQERLFYRESCYNCRYATANRVSDITIGDYWGIENAIKILRDEREKGISLIMFNNKRASEYTDVLKKYMVLEDGLYEVAKHGQMNGTTSKPIGYNEIDDEIENPIKYIKRHIPIKRMLLYCYPRIYMFFRRIRRMLSEK